MNGKLLSIIFFFVSLDCFMYGMEQISPNLFEDCFPEELCNKILVEAFYDKNSVNKLLNKNVGAFILVSSLVTIRLYYN
ncbi:hypothetical protein EKK58_06810 [Candidatus Dependentiae bacterium]|nr:MAG: hypothetical protein EKK58_06810 [Candidatus Dependentiae bacterium]